MGLCFILLDNEKSAALARSKWNFDAYMSISSGARSDIVWWIENIEHASNPVHRPKPSSTLQADASLVGWGGG